MVRTEKPATSTWRNTLKERIVDPLKVGWHRAQMHYLRGNDAKAYANGFAGVIDPN